MTPTDEIREKIVDIICKSLHKISYDQAANQILLIETDDGRYRIAIIDTKAELPKIQHSDDIIIPLTEDNWQGGLRIGQTIMRQAMWSAGFRKEVK